MIQQELAGQQSLLDNGLAQAGRVLSLQGEASRLNGSVGELKSSAARGEAQIIETDIQILQLSSARHEEAITTLRDLTCTEIEMVERNCRWMKRCRAWTCARRCLGLCTV